MSGTVTKLFGSGSVLCLPKAAGILLGKRIDDGVLFVVGDAQGADACFREWLWRRRYPGVRVFFPGPEPRRNVGQWPGVRIPVGSGMRGFAFHVATDRAMARAATEAICIWDGTRRGSARNIRQPEGEGKPVHMFPWPDAGDRE